MRDSAPNKSLQRPRFALLRAPLSRKPLGDQRTALMKRRRTCILVVLVGLMADQPLFSKCMLRPVPIRLSTKDSCTGRPVPNVALAVFTNDDQYGVDLKPAAGKTDQQGTFEGSFFFNTYSGTRPPGTDQCDRRLARLTVVATCRGYADKRIEFSGQRLRTVTNHGGGIELPPIEMVPAR
jgi:hypothetical protein